MIRQLRFIAPIVAMVMASPCFAAYTVALKTYNSGGGETSVFALGDVVTVSLVAEDTSGSFTGLASTSASILATTTDADDYSNVTYNAALGTGITVDGPPLNTDIVGLSDGASFGTSGAAVDLANPVEVFSFDFTFDGPGDTTIRLTDFILTDVTGADIGFEAAGSITSATVTAVPEPTTFAVLGLLSAGAGVRTYRRRKLRQ
ncbi:PEP-CTERM sorting domain-containing protein [Crateriforma conspicua]|uniref:Ice-binding protein C-terminal domain-containing protein n=1 Tax=Crateriforma conspicua TaxID=2527996 RepID=A0A5C5XRR6_9PLAN|nr:PEP-CTERM sorting domain-containing protein [Crateriforma conspicua]TWT65540.1 hypothetical protein Pan14r_50870 [Crateriforma conspicua]